VTGDNEHLGYLRAGEHIEMPMHQRLTTYNLREFRL
jgi:hypothetical protein